MRMIIKAVILSFMLYPFVASAIWTTSTEDDIFTGGKKATTVASIGDSYGDNAIIFECTKNNLKFSYIERASDPSKAEGAAVDLIVKIDSGDVKRMNGIVSPRNSNYVQVTADDRDTIIQILKESAKAKSKMVVGLSNESIGQSSFTVNAVGSSKAVSQFVTACEIPIK